MVRAFERRCRGRLAVLSKEPAQGATCQIGSLEPSACEAKAARSPIGASAAETSRRRGCRGAVRREMQWCSVVAPVSDDGDQQRTLAFDVACLPNGSERSRAESKRSIPDPGTRTRILPESRGTATQRRSRSQESQERHPRHWPVYPTQGSSVSQTHVAEIGSLRQGPLTFDAI